MPRYISLIQFTEKGVREMKDSTARGHAFSKAAQKAGVRVEGQYWTVGAFDGVLILNAEAEEKVVRCLTQLAAFGYVRTQTLRAFTDQEWEEIVGK